MKLKCIDNKIRDFSPSGKLYPYTESVCNECGYRFDVHSTSILKPRWRKHICYDVCSNCGKKRNEMKHIVIDGQYNCKNCGHYLGKIREKKK